MAQWKSPLAARSAGFGDGADRAGDLVAKVGEHVFEQHADQVFVFDHENTLGRL